MKANSFLRAMVVTGALFFTATMAFAQKGIVPSTAKSIVNGVQGRANKQYKQYSSEVMSDVEIGTTFGRGGAFQLEDNSRFGSDLRFTLTSFTFRPFADALRITADLGLGKTSIRLDDGYVFRYNDKKLGIEDFGNDALLKKSVLRSAVLSSSLLAGMEIGGFVELFGGIQVDYNTPATAVNKYEHKAHVGKEKITDIPVNRFTYNIKGGIAFEDFGVYVKYTPCNLLKASSGLEFQRFAVGLIIR